VSASVGEGEVVSLLGQNGAGKTTLVRAVAGLAPTWAGSVEIGQRTMKGRRPSVRAQRGLGVVLDGKRVFPSLTVAQNLAIPNGSQKIAAQSVDAVFSVFPALKEMKHRRASALSGGQQQMLTIAQALLLKPRVLVLDEPSAGLAPILVLELFQKLRQLADSGLAILLVEQLVDLALAVSDRVLVMRLGRLVGEWPGGDTQQESVRQALALGMSHDTEPRPVEGIESCARDNGQPTKSSKG
jgi:branched-chain amino acid transport system ATP-binding protein